MHENWYTFGTSKTNKIVLRKFSVGRMENEIVKEIIILGEAGEN